MSKTIKISLFFLLFTCRIVAQTDSGKEQDAAILEKFFQTVSKNTIDSSMIRAALFFQNTPYVAATLEVNDEEKLVINLRELDCTTFVENCLALARILQSTYPDQDGFEQELRKIRYRNGQINGYTSRLHYTSDWIFDNVGAGIVEDMTHALGGHKLKPDVHFMSENYRKYIHLADNPEDVQRMMVIEREINARGNYFYIPKQEISKHQSLIRSGDIVCFTTSMPGLDISHLGIAYWHKGRLTFIHASSTAKKVIINPESLADYCSAVKTNTGIMVLRPLS
ncbi:xylanase [Bacteroidia bacterium]|nr:xylanase [Bacteroidia bacterium]